MGAKSFLKKVLTKFYTSGIMVTRMNYLGTGNEYRVTADY